MEGYLPREASLISAVRRHTQNCTTAARMQALEASGLSFPLLHRGLACRPAQRSCKLDPAPPSLLSRRSMPSCLAGTDIWVRARVASWIEGLKGSEAQRRLGWRPGKARKGLARTPASGCSASRCYCGSGVSPQPALSHASRLKRRLAICIVGHPESAAADLVAMLGWLTQDETRPRGRGQARG
ncbi:hypothetical protein L1887_61400 [Cichorium endivia]|nr:hypothetical protein L1887_61400 [Cichorium endivia]